jgi:hypothetical protein
VLFLYKIFVVELMELPVYTHKCNCLQEDEENMDGPSNSGDGGTSSHQSVNGNAAASSSVADGSGTGFARSLELSGNVGNFEMSLSDVL